MNRPRKRRPSLTQILREQDLELASPVDQKSVPPLFSAIGKIEALMIAGAAALAAAFGVWLGAVLRALGL